MLILDILRHGRAEPTSNDGDAGRPLTVDGAEAVRALGRRLVAAGWRPARIFASPFKRARDTAHVLTESLELTPLIETLLELEPEAEPQAALDALEIHGAIDGHILIVSHMPLVARICTHLTRNPDPLSPGEMRRIACPDGMSAGSGRIEPVPGNGHGD